MEEKPGGPPRREAGVREHLANERTPLSWARTGVGLASLGLVVEQTNAHPGNHNASIGASGIFGVALAVAFVVYLAFQTFP